MISTAQTGCLLFIEEDDDTVDIDIAVVSYNIGLFSFLPERLGQAVSVGRALLRAVNGAPITADGVLDASKGIRAFPEVIRKGSWVPRQQYLRSDTIAGLGVGTEYFDVPVDLFLDRVSFVPGFAGSFFSTGYSLSGVATLVLHAKYRKSNERPERSISQGYLPPVGFHGGDLYMPDGMPMSNEYLIARYVDRVDAAQYMSVRYVSAPFAWLWGGMFLQDYHIMIKPTVHLYDGCYWLSYPYQPGYDSCALTIPDNIPDDGRFVLERDPVGFGWSLFFRYNSYALPAIYFPLLYGCGVKKGCGIIPALIPSVGGRVGVGREEPLTGVLMGLGVGLGLGGTFPLVDEDDDYLKSTDDEWLRGRG
jgi:hypothetical protein